MKQLPANTELESLNWIPRPRLLALHRLKIFTLADLLHHFPRRYEDRRKFDRFPDQASDQAVCLFGIIKKTTYRRFGGRRIFETRIEDEHGGVLSSPLICRWFNMPWIQKAITGGDRIVIYGKPKMRSKQIVMEHPEFEIMEDDAEHSLHFDRIVPIYPAGEGINSRALRVLIHQAISNTDFASMPFLWPARKGQLTADIWKAIHFPDSNTAREEARGQLVCEEFFRLQLIVCSRHAAATQNGGVARRGPGALWEKVLKSLPFELTASQREVMTEICADLASPRRMNRLLQGDVGSGKTLVALQAMLQVVEAGWQAALMAPTQILAEQHYLNFRRILDPLGIPVALHTAARREGMSGEMPDTTPGTGVLPGMDVNASRRMAPLVIGTHALLFENATFERLGLVVIDEQHKFGVLQRSRLIARGEAPDVLVMTATPIPRTITQTLYGDLDVSILRDKPAGRGEIVTAVRDTSKLPDIIEFLRKKIGEGCQAYIVYPLVEESEKLEAKAATVEFEKWRDLLVPASVGLIHGRLPAVEKEAIMKSFREGKISVLVATTVIEVGVDVPNASLMLIEDAERFGLSQIHQLRGRIGRGHAKSYCILVHSKSADVDKLAVLEKTSDGFAIAEADLQLRGPGDILGTAQTGLPPLRIGDLLRDGAVMTQARVKAQEIFAKDPNLSTPEHLHLRDSLEKTAAVQQIAASG